MGWMSQSVSFLNSYAQILNWGNISLSLVMMPPAVVVFLRSFSQTSQPIILMSGHSKWSQINRQKSVTDAARSRVFSRYARLIAMESKKANGMLSAPSLSVVIARAKAANMPKENIERAIPKSASKDSGNLEQVVYEAYGPGGVAIIIEALTDNKNRTTQEIKHLLIVLGVELASPGAA